MRIGGNFEELCAKRIFVVQLVVLTMTLCCTSLFAQEKATQKVTQKDWKRGYHGFNMICQGVGLEQVDLRKARIVPTHELIVVALGDLGSAPISLNSVIYNGGAVLVASDSRKSDHSRFSGITFRRSSGVPVSRHDKFANFDDCPLVSDISRSHEITMGVKKIATNIPGALETRHKRLASLPLRANGPTAFLAAVEYPNGGRVVGVADQSVFSNQMLIYRDNALFTDQTIRWLKAGNREGGIRKYVFVVSNGVEYTHLDPADVEIEIPPPTGEEIVDAIKNLPPSAMLEFANSVATVVEDDDLVNDFIHDELDKVEDGKLNRILLFLMFGVICLSFIAAFLFQKKLLRNTGSEVAAEKSRRAHRQQKSIQARERQWAAHVLLDTLCVDIANRQYNDWPGFPLGLELGDTRDGIPIFKEMTKASNLYKSKSSSYWTRSRLRQLESDTTRWRQWMAERGLKMVRPDVVMAATSQSMGVVDASLED